MKSVWVAWTEFHWIPSAVRWACPSTSASNCRPFHAAIPISTIRVIKKDFNGINTCRLVCFKSSFINGWPWTRQEPWAAEHPIGLLARVHSVVPVVPPAQCCRSQSSNKSMYIEQKVHIIWLKTSHKRDLDQLFHARMKLLRTFQEARTTWWVLGTNTSSTLSSRNLRDIIA